MVKERPIIFNTEMVKAILDGRKTQTRRVIKPQPEQITQGKYYWSQRNRGMLWVQYTQDDFLLKCQYGKIGDRLWVRETWSTDADIEAYRKENEPVPVVYKVDWDADGITKEEARDAGIIWKPSIFMPRWASRIDLEITDIRVERVQDINPEDCEAEGITGETKTSPVRGLPYEVYKCLGLTYSTPRIAFENLWDSINAKRGYGWEVNPWVWCISFKKGAING